MYKIDILIDLMHFSVCTYLSLENVMIGEVVEVNLRGKKKQGIVIANPSKLNVNKGLKYITARTWIKFNVLTVKIIEYISRYYYVSQAKVVSLFLNKYLIYKNLKSYYLTVNEIHKKIDNVKINLSKHQQSVVNDLVYNKPNLIFGVTGSGKTEVYFNIIHKYILARKQVLILLPEINLVLNIAERFKKRFGFDALVWHSKSLQKSKSINYIINNYLVVIGTRSSLFLPFQNLACIIVDEEHDISYKQDTQVLYNARDLAVLFGHIYNLQVCLFSATPTLESYYNSVVGKYNLLHLNEQYSNINLAQMRCIQFDSKKSVKILPKTAEKSRFNEVDSSVKDQILTRFGGASDDKTSDDKMLNDQNKDNSLNMQLRNKKQQLDSIDSKIVNLQKNSEKAFLHSDVLLEIKNVLRRGEQVMIYLNRKGYYRMVFCRNCNQEVKCKNCSIPLVWYNSKKKLYCHYCDSHFLLSCLDCEHDEHDEANLCFYGLGIEQLYEYVNKLFGKEFCVDYITSDSSNISDIIEKFTKGEIHIVITTQIMAKGYHFANLTLVVMLNMELQSCPTNFRFSENNLQMIYQVRGRCGREKRGEVILQSLKKVSSILPYKDFLNQELVLRKNYDLPPITKMIGVMIFGFNEKLVKDEAHEVLKFYMQKYDRIMGPVESLVYKVNNNYRLRIFIIMSKKELFLGGYDFFIGTPDSEFHGVYHQNKILSNTKGGSIDQKSLECLNKIKTLAEKLNIAVPDLIIYLLGIN
ncbi:MAG: primosomal protein N' [Pseudomonadota bacterium]